MKREEILRTAESLINGDRAKDYGDALENHWRIAIGWDVIVKSAYEKGKHLQPEHVALMMDWLKTARLCNSIDHKDSWIDKAAYSALGGEMASND